MKGYFIGLGIGLLFVLLSYLSWNSTVYGLGHILGPYIFSFLFPAIAFISLVYGLIKLVRRNKISKDEKITRLEKRLDDMEKDKDKKL